MQLLLPCRCLNDILTCCVCPLLKVILELQFSLWIVYRVFELGVVPSCGLSLSRFVDSQLVSVYRGEGDVVKDIFIWFDASRSQSLRSLQLGFDLLDFIKGVVGDNKVVCPVPYSLWSNMGFPIPFRLLLCAGFPRVDEGQVVSCERTDQSCSAPGVGVRLAQIPRGRLNRLP